MEHYPSNSPTPAPTAHHAQTAPVGVTGVLLLPTQVTGAVHTHDGRLKEEFKKSAGLQSAENIPEQPAGRQCRHCWADCDHHPT